MVSPRKTVLWRQDLAGPAAVIAGLLLAGLVTLRPLGGAGGDGSLFLCLRCGSFGSVDVVLNTLLFMPIGIGLAISGLRASRAILISVLVTLAIETLQFALIEGRYASLSDVLSNSLGGGLGFVVGRHWRVLVFPSRRAAGVIGLTVVSCWGGSRLLTAWLLVPSLPDSRWYGQVAPKRVYPGAFRGQVLDARIAGEPLTIGPEPELRARMLTEGPSISATVTEAEPTPLLSSVVSVFDARRREIILLGQEGRDARLRLRLRAADQKFRLPSLRLPNAFVAGPGTVETVNGEFRAGVLSLEVVGQPVARRSSLRLGPGLGWALLLPFDRGLTPRLAETVSLALAALVCLLIGFLGDRTVRGPLSQSFAPVLAAGALGLWAPLIVFSGAGPSAAEVLVCSSGALSGALLSRGLLRWCDGRHLPSPLADWFSHDICTSLPPEARLIQSPQAANTTNAATRSRDPARTSRPDQAARHRRRR